MLSSGNPFWRAYTGTKSQGANFLRRYIYGGCSDFCHLIPRLALGARTSRQPSTMNLCTQCSSAVRPRQEALQCDICQRWTHRACGTGMTRNFYWQLVRDGLDFDWNCPECNEGLQRTAEATDIATNDSLPPQHHGYH